MVSRLALALLAAMAALAPCAALKRRSGGSRSGSSSKQPTYKVDGVSVEESTRDWVAARTFHATHASTAGDELRYFLRTDGQRAAIRDTRNVCEAQADIGGFELHNATVGELHIADGQQAYVYFVCGMACDELRCYTPVYVIVIAIAAVLAVAIAAAAFCYCKCKAKKRRTEQMQQQPPYPTMAPAAPPQQLQQQPWMANAGAPQMGVVGTAA